MKRVDIRLRASDPSLDTGWLWRLAKGYTKKAWDGKIAVHMPLADMGQAKTRNEWHVSHLPSGNRMTVLECNLETAIAAVDFACSCVDGWSQMMEFDHHAVDAGDWPHDKLKEFRDVVRDHRILGGAAAYYQIVKGQV